MLGLERPHYSRQFHVIGIYLIITDTGPNFYVNLLLLFEPHFLKNILTNLRSRNWCK